MNIQKEVVAQMKVAMKSKDKVALTALRALKSVFMLAATDGTEELTESEEFKIVQKQVKQRKDSAKVFIEQGRNDLADPELEEAKVLSQFLPKALSESEISVVVKEVIAKLGAEGMKDMGKVMGLVSKQLVGQADGQIISTIVKQELV